MNTGDATSDNQHGRYAGVWGLQPNLVRSDHDIRPRGRAVQSVAPPRNVPVLGRMRPPGGVTAGQLEGSVARITPPP